MDNEKRVDDEKVAEMQRLLREGGEDAVTRRYAAASVASDEFREAQCRREIVRKNMAERRQMAMEEEEKRQARLAEERASADKKAHHNAVNSAEVQDKGAEAEQATVNKAEKAGKSADGSDVTNTGTSAETAQLDNQRQADRPVKEVDQTQRSQFDRLKEESEREAQRKPLSQEQSSSLPH
ncbi:Hypothetical protein CGLY_11755 [Corynebacterium glyciniphilum AJ 3170]|uniref:Uncharacterized protein n=1 Tax=Corynebacterium glyciniphilum AJ 3170 TaxID=1404245 RepID=X5EDZ3_9CORY|nr:hypothetical protein [Corynebacterium glyciniphilum]AHW64796.1 Hypothetical protein CGLY_11755 [Corynebacterium glyciniphilum AJ 3170]